MFSNACGSCISLASSFSLLSNVHAPGPISNVHCGLSIASNTYGKSRHATLNVFPKPCKSVEEFSLFLYFLGNQQFWNSPQCSLYSQPYCLLSRHSARLDLVRASICLLLKSTVKSSRLLKHSLTYKVKRHQLVAIPHLPRLFSFRNIILLLNVICSPYVTACFVSFGLSNYNP